METQALFELMAQQVKDYALFLLDPNGKVLSWNTGAALIKGYRADEIIGHHFSVFYPAEAVNAGWPAHELRTAQREGSFEDEGYRVRKDGSLFWANVVITAVRDETGKLVAFSKITRDLTGRRLREEELRESEERFRLLVGGVVDYAIYMLDPQGVVSSWNLGAQRMKGYRPDEIIGKHFSNFYAPEDIDSGKPWHTLARARNEGHAEDEGWRVRKNGERFWARVVVNAVHDSAGHLRGFSKVTQDLSDKRHIQELQAAASRVNEFIAVLAHELRNPLAPIQNALEVMNRAAPDEPVQVSMRKIIERQTERLREVVNDMVDISRVTHGMLTVDRKPVDVADLIERSLEPVAPLIEAQGHRLKVEVPSEKLVVCGDLQRLVQVLSNLLGNAARYTPAGGLISVKAWRDRQQVVISVKDTGRGMSAEALSSSFQMFVQGRPPLKRIGEGLGIGLALARKIAELHGGTLEAFSEGEGKGSELLVRLPVAGQGVPGEGREATKAAIAEMRTAPRRVLIVDDNVDAASTLHLLLDALGHETRVVHDGMAALEAFDEFHPQLVLLDIGLPGIDGYEVARRFRARQRQGVRIVAVTGWGQAEDRDQSSAAGFDLHLVKPVDEEQLRQILQSSSQLHSSSTHCSNGTVH
jgi:PAS domain S-box-containing protein